MDNICKNENNMFLNLKLRSEVSWSLMKQAISSVLSLPSSSITSMFFSLHPHAKSRLESLNAATTVSWLQFRHATRTLSHVAVASALSLRCAAATQTQRQVRQVPQMCGGWLSILFERLLSDSSVAFYICPHLNTRKHMLSGRTMQIHLLECRRFTRWQTRRSSVLISWSQLAFTYIYI